MIKIDKKQTKSGLKHNYRVVEGYRDSEGKVKQRTIKSFGNIEDAADPKLFVQDVQDYEISYFLSKKKKKDSFSRPFDESEFNQPINYGYRFLESIYDSLEIDKFFDNKVNKCEYDLNEIFKYLVIQRILAPDSKRASFQKKDLYYGLNLDFKLENVYRSLSKFDTYKEELQKYLNDSIKKKIGRQTDFAFYDVTNYYCEIDFQDPDENGLRKRGVSKEHRVDPIIQLGLFIDDNGLPISMRLFKGNTSDSLTLRPVLEEIKKNYGLKRLIVVADKGLNSSKNINFIVNNGDGYVVSQILRGKKGKQFEEKLFDDSLYTYNKDKDFKYQTYEEDYDIIDGEGNKVTKKRKVLIYWRKADDEMAKKKRNEKIERAKRSLENNVFTIDHSNMEYVKSDYQVEKTGEKADEVVRKIDEEKIKADEKYDGYFCLITSELDYDYKKILEVYGGLWRIEESFRITKSDLEVRPIYCSTESHINGHFIICFVALLIIRMLQYKMNYSLSVERIVNALNSSNLLVEEDNTIMILKNNTNLDYKCNSLQLSQEIETLKDYINIIETFKINKPYERYKIENFKNYLTSIKY